MKFSSSLSLVGASVAAFAGVAAAQDCVATALKAIPSCAQSCFLNGAPSIGCGGTDFQCQCNSQAKLFAAVEGCVQSACPSASYQPVIDGASTVCACAASVAGPTAVGSNTVAPSNTVLPTATATTTPTSKPTSVPTAAANRPAVGTGKELGIMAGVLGGTLLAAIAL